MCGIVGAFPLNVQNLDIDPNTRRRAALFLHNEILLETVERGRDATGMAVAFGSRYGEQDESRFWTVLKQPVDTADFFLNDGTNSRYNGQDEGANLNNLMDVAFTVERPLLHILGHTRRKTIGSEYSPLNNHPIMVDKVIGVHNGGVKNTEEIYKIHKEMTPLGEVDSEAIFQLLAERIHDEDRPLNLEDLKYVTQRIVGPRAVFAYNRYRPEKVLFFRDKERPLELAYLPELGLAILLSEKKFLSKALFVYHRARLTASRDLPELSVHWMNINADKGGVIDIETPIDGEAPLHEIFPLVDTAKVLDEYEPETKSYGGNQWSTGSQHGGYSDKNRTAGFKSAGTTENSNTTPPAPKTGTGSSTTSSVTNKKTGGLVQADLVDISTYGAEKPSTVDLSNADIMDDPEVGESSNVSELFTLDELVKRGSEWALGEEAREDKTLLIHRYKGRFRDYVGIAGVRESEAAELTNQMFAEAFGEGYAVGYRAGAAEQAESDSAPDVKGLEDEVVALREKLLESKTKQRRAAAFIANMKAFVMAAILTKDLATVEESDDGELSMKFDSDLREFIRSASGFEKASPGMVRDLFSERDLKAIAHSFSQTARQVRSEVSAQQVAKSIKN